ncbi:hypothetical protein B0J14DRAFT_588825 [Halenospora varia]|nr:hypothetical protein B0J14DRAFT_588825 [Halenospora varia]
MSQTSASDPSHDPQESTKPSERQSDEDLKKERQSYPAQCHCGAVTFTVTISPPLLEYKVMQCNCSICNSHGYLLVYPYRTDVVFHGDSEAQVQKYQFHTKKKDHWFCKQCGTSLLIDFNAIYPNWDVMAVNVSNASEEFLHKNFFMIQH